MTAAHGPELVNLIVGAIPVAVATATLGFRYFRNGLRGGDQ